MHFSGAGGAYNCFFKFENRSITFVLQLYEDVYFVNEVSFEDCFFSQKANASIIFFENVKRF